MLGYMNAGGRLFLSHLHFYWLRSGPAPLPTTATYIGVGPKLDVPAPGTVNTTFPKGNALADWLVTVGASTTRGQLDIYARHHSVAAVTAPTQSWITVPANTAATGPQPSVQYMTFNTPVGTPEASQCGRVVLTDLHMNASIGNMFGGDN